MANEHRSQTIRDRYGAAVHEAGHAIVASALGLRVGCIEIAIDDDEAKAVVEIEDSAELDLIDQLAICAAGMEAQRMFSARTHDGAGWADQGMMIGLVQHLNADDSQRVRYAGHQRAHDLLIEHTGKVERLAELLLNSRRLEAEDLAAFFRKT
ncbi:hypothetical protein [Bradyrhizobium sp. ORS 375]|uniref:hypothetical protein n=1 Tax=Bradyrhizobium sp. (strain ORS 375) TaxID=566679 RepID=UPI001111D9BB|nr:hypothetical protein [Bradyrhizobium sp. ORS 375]